MEGFAWKEMLALPTIMKAMAATDSCLMLSTWPPPRPLEGPPFVGDASVGDSGGSDWLSRRQARLQPERRLLMPPPMHS